MSKDKIKLTGSFVLRVRRKDGTVRLVKRGKNLVTTVGLTEVAELIANVATNVPSHIAIGEGGTDPTLAETALVGPEHDRQTAALSQVGPQVTVSSTTLGAGLGATQTVKEVGVFNAAAAGDMYARFLTGEFTLDPDERVEIDWTLTIS